jgi:hypothetical protein
LELAHTSDVERQSLTNPVAMADLTQSPLPWIRNLGIRPVRPHLFFGALDNTNGKNALIIGG